jgi:hypothetical protein
MPPAKKKQTRPRYASTLSKWHRRTGITSALFVVWLALTGLLLGHTDDLTLSKRYLVAGWLLDWYGIPVPHEVAGVGVAEDWISQVGESLYFNDRPVDGEYGSLQGAVRLPESIVIATNEQLVMLTPNGDPLEVLGPTHAVPRDIRRIGVHGELLIVHAGQYVYAFDAALLAWHRVQDTGVNWSQRAELPDALRKRVVENHRGRLLTLERLVLDLHSGRLFGRPGVFVMNLAAIAFLVLAVSGVVTWIAQKTRLSNRKETS